MKAEVTAKTLKVMDGEVVTKTLHYLIIKVGEKEVKINVGEKTVKAVEELNKK